MSKKDRGLNKVRYFAVIDPTGPSGLDNVARAVDETPWTISHDATAAAAGPLQVVYVDQSVEDEQLAERGQALASSLDDYALDTKALGGRLLTPSDQPTTRYLIGSPRRPNTWKRS